MNLHDMPQPDGSLSENAELVEYVNGLISSHSFSIRSVDFARPWGGFYVLQDNDAKTFADTFFPDMTFSSYENLSPKFLLVAPERRLSWQYHNRRAEIWRVLRGPVGIKLGNSDEQPDEVTELAQDEIIQFDALTRHRLIGLPGHWGVVAEIWKHTDPTHPSNEDDIVRVQDDFNR